MTTDWEEFVKQFKETDKSDFADISSCKKPLDFALWVLCITKDKFDKKKLMASQIASILVDAEEYSINVHSITNALKRASDKVHRYYENGVIYYEIMKSGRDYLFSLHKSDIVNAFYFEPDTRYTTKKLFKNQIFSGLTGNLKILDPYCSEKTLDVLTTLKDRPIQFITRLANLRERDKEKLVRDIADFKTEHPAIEFRDYTNADIHDRYIISEDKVAIIGHSIKDLGTKESFVVVLNHMNNNELYEALSSNFINRWNTSNIV